MLNQWATPLRTPSASTAPECLPPVATLALRGEALGHSPGPEGHGFRRWRKLFETHLGLQNPRFVRKCGSNPAVKSRKETLGYVENRFLGFSKESFSQFQPFESFPPPV